MNISQKQMRKLIDYVDTYSRYKELYSLELRKDKPDWAIVEDRLDMAYSYAKMIISILDGTGVNPDKVAECITYFVELYKDEMEAKFEAKHYRREAA